MFGDLSVLLLDEVLHEPVDGRMLPQDVAFAIAEEVTVVELAVVEKGITILALQLKLLFWSGGFVSAQLLQLGENGILSKREPTLVVMDCRS